MAPCVFPPSRKASAGRTWEGAPGINGTNRAQFVGGLLGLGGKAQGPLHQSPGRRSIPWATAGGTASATSSAIAGTESGCRHRAAAPSPRPLGPPRPGLPAGLARALKAPGPPRGLEGPPHLESRSAAHRGGSRKRPRPWSVGKLAGVQGAAARACPVSLPAVSPSSQATRLHCVPDTP